MWHVSSHSGEACLRNAILNLLTLSLPAHDVLTLIRTSERRGGVSHQRRSLSERCNVRTVPVPQ